MEHVPLFTNLEPVDNTERGAENRRRVMTATATGIGRDTTQGLDETPERKRGRGPK